MADLTQRTGDAHDRDEAIARLSKATDEFHPDTHARARGLCAARIGLLHATSGNHNCATGSAGRTGR